MTWFLDDIKLAYDAGEIIKATHMIVAYDSFDNSNYPIYVLEGEDPQDKKPSNGDRVDEVYKYSLGWEFQSKERRAMHWEKDD